LSLLKDFSADATVAGIVNNILKLTQTFRNISQAYLFVKKNKNKLFNQMVMGVHQKKLRVKVVHREKRLRTTAFNDV
jgi:hypothetical protein